MPLARGIALALLVVAAVAPAAVAGPATHPSEERIAELREYHDSGRYARDLRAVNRSARRYLRRELRDGVRRPAIVLDVDETSLSNWARLSASDFGAKPVPKTVGARSVPFRNVIYDYTLGQAMADGFVKEPAVATRKDFDPRSVGEQELEQIERQHGQEAKAREEAKRQQQAARLIKGNINREGEKIYHLPGQAGYDRVQAEETFETEEQAMAAGFRRSQAPGGGTIKGKVNRDGEKIYHLPGQANYERVEADFLFESEEQAQANGFRAAQR